MSERRGRVVQASDEMHTVYAPVEFTDPHEFFAALKAAVSNRKSVVEQLHDNRAGIDAYFVDLGKPNPSGWVRIDSEGNWYEVDTDWVQEYSTSPTISQHSRQYRRVLKSVTYLEELYAPRPGSDIAIEFFILRLRREYVMAIIAIERQDWESAMLRVFEAGRLQQIIDERQRLKNVKTGSRMRRHLGKQREVKRRKSAENVELRREVIRELLKTTKLTRGALVLHLSKKTGASRRTIQYDLRAIR